MAQFTKRAERDLSNLPESLQGKARALIARLETEPALGKKLLGPLAGKRSIWLGRSHRIIYTLDPIVILTIVPRRDAYR
ncbi:type II toxin-antitoxin system RelE family toxin [Actinocorallia libanotica]|uniref:type II toxin-antitoxin system RelE family toxin n=1 Tax=Actinocorallia libanotica TaxID=46162 RepID=UPI003CD0B700